MSALSAWSWISLSALALSAAACEPTPPERVTASADTKAAIPNIATPRITWPAASTRDARSFATLGDAARANELLARSPVPVIAPTNVGTFERPTFVVGAEYYALTGRLNGVTIAIQGTRAARRYEGIAPIAGDRTLRSARGFVSLNEGIRTASWIENGAAYSVDVECADPTDARCTSDAFVVEFIENLAFAGGVAP